MHCLRQPIVSLPPRPADSRLIDSAATPGSPEPLGDGTQAAGTGIHLARGGRAGNFGGTGRALWAGRGGQRRLPSRQPWEDADQPRQTQAAVPPHHRARDVHCRPGPAEAGGADPAAATSSSKLTRRSGRRGCSGTRPGCVTLASRRRGSLPWQWRGAYKPPYCLL